MFPVCDTGNLATLIKYCLVFQMMGVCHRFLAVAELQQVLRGKEGEPHPAG
jgi:hypothetical protein